MKVIPKDINVVLLSAKGEESAHETSLPLYQIVLDAVKKSWDVISPCLRPRSQRAAVGLTTNCQHKRGWESLHLRRRPIPVQ